MVEPSVENSHNPADSLTMQTMQTMEVWGAVVELEYVLDHIVTPGTNRQVDKKMGALVLRDEPMAVTVRHLPSQDRLRSQSAILQLPTGGSGLARRNSGTNLRGNCLLPPV